MKPGNQQKASLSSFLWFLSFCRTPRPRLLGVGSRAVVGKALPLFPDARYISKANGSVQPAHRPLLSWCCQTAPTHVGGRGDKRLRRTAVVSFLVRQPASARSAPYCFHGGGLHEVLLAAGSHLCELHEDECPLPCLGGLPSGLSAPPD